MIAAPKGAPLQRWIPTASGFSRFRLELIREPFPGLLPRGRLNLPGTAHLLHRIVRGSDREVVGALYLDSHGIAIGYTIAYVGTLARTAVEPRGLLVPGLLANAARLIAFHNHPGGGEATPSSSDLVFTRQLAEAGDLVGLEVIDHLILGEEPHCLSLRERGVL